MNALILIHFIIFENILCLYDRLLDGDFGDQSPLRLNYDWAQVTISSFTVMVLRKSLFLFLNALILIHFIIFENILCLYDRLLDGDTGDQ